MHVSLETRCPQKLIGTMSFVAPLHWPSKLAAMPRTTASHTVKAIEGVFHSLSFSGFITKKQILLLESVPLIQFFGFFFANYTDRETM